MVKVFLIILGEWRYFGHILYEKLSYILSVLPDLVRELSYLIKKLIKSLYSLKVSIRKKEVNVKLYVDVRFNFITNFIRYLDQKDKEAYKRYYEEEKERREKKLAAWESWAKGRDEWVEEELSNSLNSLRDYLLRKEKKVNDWFYLRKVKFEEKVNNRIKVFYEGLAKRIAFYKGEVEKINPTFLLWESKRKKKFKRWREWVKLKSPKFKPFLEKLIQIQDIPPHVQRFIVKWIFNPGVDYFVTKWIKFLDWGEEKDWIRKSRKIEGIIEKFNFYETVFKEKGGLYGSGVIKVWVPRFYLYWKKVPVFQYKRQYFYQRYLKGVEKHNDWWYNVIKKGVRKEVFNEEDLRGLCLRLNLGRLRSTYRFLFEIDEGRWKSIEGVERRILENQKVSFFFRTIGRGYRFFLLIVMSDPFFYAWNVFFLVTGVYMLLILAPIIIFFEWFRVKKR